jgi:UDP-glucose 4-epimerase
LIVYGDGGHTRDYIHVDDIIACNLFAAKFETSFGGACFDVGTGMNYSLDYIKKYVQSKHNVVFKHLDARKSDALSTEAVTDPLLKLGWEAKVRFYDGLKECF